MDLTRLPRPILPAHPEWLTLHDTAWRLAATHIRELRGRRYMDAAWDPARNYQWVWDTCFMALYCRYGADAFPGVESLDNFYDLQRRDGYISMTYDLDSGNEVWPDRINPPLFAWVEWEYCRTTGDTSRLARVIPHIERLMDWIDANRRTRPHRSRRSTAGKESAEIQLYYFEDCGSSGMDDSPRTPRLQDAGGFFDWIDLSSQMALSFRMLGRLHALAGAPQRAAHWENRARALGRLINAELWCERTRFYHDRFLPMNFVASKTAAGFWPILAGLCDRERLDALVTHLLDPREFHRPTPVPSLSADDPNYTDNGVYWRGGVWAPINYMVARGLMLAGRGDVAHGIAVRYLDALARTYAKVAPHTLWECYSSEADLPALTPYSGTRVKPHFVGWTGIGPTAMLIENVLGLDLDRLAGRLTWDIRLTVEHGMERIALGDRATATVHCAARRSNRATAQVTLHADRPLNVRLRRGCELRNLRLRAGTTETVTV